MAQTRKKRRTKHRGNAAGIVESRGRTGRKPTAGERKAGVREEARERRLDRASRPPTWRSAVIRAAVSALLFAVLIILFFDQKVGQAVAMSVFVFAFYIPLGYFTDRFVYQRRLRKQQQA